MTVTDLLMCVCLGVFLWAMLFTGVYLLLWEVL